jgi:uncharacterized integral membrane protein
LKHPKFIIALILIALVVILLIQNRQDVTLEIYFWKISMPQIIFMPLLLLIGFFAGYGVAWLRGKPQNEKEPESQQ